LDREWTEQIVAACAVAGLAGLLKHGGDRANASRTDRLRGALELVRGCRQLASLSLREADSISRSVSTAVSRNFSKSELSAARSSRRCPSRREITIHRTELRLLDHLAGIVEAVNAMGDMGSGFHALVARLNSSHPGNVRASHSLI
jgi:hypothetical protein